MSHRFFVESPIQSSDALVVGSEAHHLLHVMRAKVGDAVILFDGSGDEFEARITKLGRSDVRLEVLSRQEISRESHSPITIGVALPKGDRQRWLIEKCVELGVTSVVPLETSRGVAQPEDSALDRLRRTVIEASKQCGRNRLMKIDSATDAGVFFARANQQIDSVKLIAHPYQVDSAKVANLFSQPSETHFFVAIGPEGGFTDEEISVAIGQNWHPIALGQRILRVETAALAVASLLAMRRLTTDSP